MSAPASEYDHGVNTYSPEGRLFQVEYAIEAVKLGTTVVGIQVKDGIVLAVEKRSTSRLLVQSAVLRKIEKLDNHIWCATSGVVPDARTLIDRARVETQTHWFNYNEPIPVRTCASSIAKICSQFGSGEMARPFGVGLLVAGVDADGAHLFYVDPSGSKTRYGAKAIGAGSESAQNSLKEQYSANMSLDDAKALAIDVIKQVMSEKLTDYNVEVAVIPLSLNAA